MQNYLNNYNKLEKYPEIYQHAKEFNVPIIMKESLELIEMLILKEASNKKEYRILEVGCAIGYSSLHFISVCPNVFVDTIERNEEMINVATSNFARYGLGRINLIKQDALEVELPVEASYDLIFIDAAKAQNIKFFNKFSPFLKNDGMIITDNLYFHGCMENPEEQSKNVRNMVRKIDEYNKFLSNHNDYITTFVPIGDGISISVRRGINEVNS